MVQTMVGTNIAMVRVGSSYSKDGFVSLESIIDLVFGCIGPVPCMRFGTSALMRLIWCSCSCCSCCSLCAIINDRELDGRNYMLL